MLNVTSWDPSVGPLQLSTLRRALEREGMTTAWWSDVPGTHVDSHAHDNPEWANNLYLFAQHLFR